MKLTKEGRELFRRPYFYGWLGLFVLLILVARTEINITTLFVLFSFWVYSLATIVILGFYKRIKDLRNAKQ